ncbi:MAG: hypothetical protein ABJF10_23715 [Chthoniobacter sp.]|uniref:hypothetical protein n=1 Tax=Chthoniobacter sp. TaxID=2510640 RepID=UPI0032A63060
MKSVLASALLILVACCGIGRAQSPDPLEAKVLLPAHYTSFDEAMTQLQKATGWKMICPDDTAKLMRVVGKMEGRPLAVQDEWLQSPRSARELLNRVCGDLALRWEFDRLAQTVAIDVPWRRADPRPAAELFQVIWQPGHETACGKEQSWWEALDSLLSKPENFARAGLVRQAADLQSMFRQFAFEKTRWWPPSDRLLELPIISGSGEHLHCLFLVHDLEFSPGHGWMSYYWFKDDGTLAGAGAMNTGHRMIVGEIKVFERGRFGEEPSEMRMTITHNNSGTPGPVRFVCGKERFKLADESGAGESLIEPGK